MIPSSQCDLIKKLSFLNKATLMNSWKKIERKKFFKRSAQKQTLEGLYELGAKVRNETVTKGTTYLRHSYVDISYLLSHCNHSKFSTQFCNVEVFVSRKHSFLIHFINYADIICWLLTSRYNYLALFVKFVFRQQREKLQNWCRSSYFF